AGEVAERAAPATAAAPAAPTPATAAAPAAAAPNDVDLVRGSRLMTPAIAISLTLLVLAAAAAISFVAMAGGLQLPTSPPSGAVLASPTPGIVPSVEPSAAPTIAPTAAPTPQATASSLPSPSPSLAPTPLPSSDRYLVLTPCPSKPDCYLYTVKRGDSLQRIARYFGVPYDTVLAMNPSITDPSTIHPGDVLELPPPTR
ncbi:MAG: LysM domain-containing protein, partial [Chloroflexota bacterium]